MLCETFVNVEQALKPQQHFSTSGFFGCMCCQKSFRSKAGEGAHMFKVHGRVAEERQLFQSTQCPVCLKEFYSNDRIQRHLRSSTQCKQRLHQDGIRYEPLPGIGASVTQQMKDLHDGLKPTMQAAGPAMRPPGQHQTRPPRATTIVTDLCATTLMAWQESGEDLSALGSRLRNNIQQLPISWTDLVTGMNTFVHGLNDEDAAAVELTVAQITDACLESIHPDQWDFLSDEFTQTSERAVSIEDWEDRFCKAAPALALLPLQPARPVGRHRFLLHAFSGRRRRGDVEHFMGAMPPREGVYIHVVSVDVILDPQWGDVSLETTRHFWLQAASQGLVLAFLGGPPCETWSKARARALASDARRAPRVIRSAVDLWGYKSTSIKESLQLLLGNLLLCFSILMMGRLAATQGCGLVEHPAEPEEADMASIWKLDIVKALLTMPGQQRVRVCQGFYGAPSAKPTDLWALNLPSLQFQLASGRVSESLPTYSSIGLNEAGEWCTSILKEYPPGFCRCLGIALFESMVERDVAEGTSPPTDFLERTAKMCASYTEHLGPDFAR
eukprot:Skav219501  [mRNA]  locus=scaffold937:332940:334607:+ [translate_table: standard]